VPGFVPRSSRPLISAGFLEVFERHLDDPDGHAITRYVVTHPGAAVVVPVDDDGAVVMVRQYRVAAERELLELPAGKLEPGEPPEVTAGRELEEEVGLTAGRLVRLGGFYNSPGFCDEFTHVYLGEALAPVDPPAGELKAEERHMTVVRVALDEALTRIGSGDIVDGKSIIGLFLARAALGVDRSDP